MKNCALLLSYLFFLINLSYAQIPNASFEEWESIDHYEEPLYWASNNSEPGLFGSPLTFVEKVPAIASGDYAMKVKTSHSGHGIATGIALLKFKPDDYYNYLTAYIKAERLDKRYIHVDISQLQDGNYREIGSEYIYETNVQPEMIAIPIQQTTLDSIKIILITYLDNVEDNIFSDAVFIIDDLEMKVDLSEPKDTILSPHPIVFPKPSQGTLFFKGLEASTIYEIFDFSGRLVQQGWIEDDQLYIDKEGIFIVRLKISENEWYTEKIIIEK